MTILVNDFSAFSVVACPFLSPAQSGRIALCVSRQARRVMNPAQCNMLRELHDAGAACLIYPMRGTG